MYQTKTYTQEQREQVELLARPLIEWLNKNADPHTKIEIETNRFAVVSGEFAKPIVDYIKD